MAQEYGQKAYDVVKEKSHELSEKADEVGQEMTSMIRRYPIQSVLLGLGVGFLVGAAIRR
jgi:ElaB/YqjD/DUF883 family membrane-anchored ribosome-binding protein